MFPSSSGYTFQILCLKALESLESEYKAYSTNSDYWRGVRYALGVIGGVKSGGELSCNLPDCYTNDLVKEYSDRTRSECKVAAANGSVF